MIYIIGLIVIALILWWLLSGGAEKQTSLVVVKPASNKSEGNITYGEWYTVATCPNCHVVIKNKDQARYYDRCCRKCGYTNGSLFDVSYEVVRDVYVDGKYLETRAKK